MLTTIDVALNPTKLPRRVPTEHYVDLERDSDFELPSLDEIHTEARAEARQSRINKRNTREDLQEVEHVSDVAELTDSEEADAEDDEH